MDTNNSTIVEMDMEGLQKVTLESVRRWVGDKGLASDVRLDGGLLEDHLAERLEPVGAQVDVHVRRFVERVTEQEAKC